jgi:hypothetical protein
MSQISFTAADVRPLPGAIVRRKTTGGTVTAGSLVYLDSSGYVQDADPGTRATSHVFGLAVADDNGGTSFASGDAIDVVVYGPVAGSSSLSEGSFAYAGTVAGQIEDSNPGSGYWQVIVGICESTSIVFINPQFPDGDSQQTS